MEAFSLVDIYNLAEIVALARIPQRRTLLGLNRVEYISAMVLSKETCQALRFDSTVRQIEKIEGIAKADTSETIEAKGELWDELEREMVQLGVRFNEEVEAVNAYKLTEAEESLFADPTKDWQNVLPQFASTLVDVEEAGRCFALGRFTASVFHSMRILEIGLAALGKEFGVATDKTNWGTIIQNIQNEIEVKSKAQGAGWADQQFYSEATLDFRFFKDAWRNHVMHVHLPVDEGKAKVISDRVRHFMHHLATKLHE